MAAIITNKFRINNANQFYESFSEASPETYYLFIGRAHAWASDVDAQGHRMMMYRQSSMLGTICWVQKL